MPAWKALGQLHLDDLRLDDHLLGGDLLNLGRYSCTSRSSRGVARMATMPDSALIDHGAAPRRCRRAPSGSSSSSGQKSEEERVEMLVPVISLTCSASLFPCIAKIEPGGSLKPCALLVRVLGCRRPRNLSVRALADLPGGHARTRGAAPLEIDIVDLEEPRLQRRRIDHESGGHAVVVVAVGIAHRVEHLDQGDVLHLQRDRAATPGSSTMLYGVPSARPSKKVRAGASLTDTSKRASSAPADGTIAADSAATINRDLKYHHG